jgi:NADH dehydrogenase
VKKGEGCAVIVLVTGATGFVGRQVVKALCSSGMEVRCLLRSPSRGEVLAGQPVDIRHGDVEDAAALKNAFHNVDAAVHLVAVIRERGEVTFERVNRRGTENVVKAARDQGVDHFIHMSAIGVSDSPAYPYLYSKWQAEQAVAASGLPYTILRPSLLFGEGDEFVNALAGLVRAFPIVPIAGPGRSKFQPIAVDEVARCVAIAVGREELMGKAIEIGGPDHLSYEDIVDTIVDTYGLRRLKLHVPLPAMRPAVRLMERLVPRPPATTEQLRMVSIPNVAGLNTVEEVFGFKPRPLRGNIEYIKEIGFREGLKISLGFMPSRIRDH